MKEKIKVLHVLPSLSGGIASLVYEYCTRMRSIFTFDFAVTSSVRGIYEDELENMGFHIFHMPRLRDSIKNYKKYFKSIILNGHYEIIHDHCDFNGYFDLKIAKKEKVLVRIAHSHRAFQSVTFKHKIEHFVFSPLTKSVSSCLFACGRDAANWAWGKNTKNVYLMKNAINVSKYLFSADKREYFRNKYNLSGKFIIGNVARLSYAKNHEFLIDIFYHIKRNNKNSVLVLVGDGEEKEKIIAKIEKYNLCDSVLLLGMRNDVSDILNMFDVFVLPSRFEGLPVSLIEAQSNGLPCFTSTTVTDEVNFIDKIRYMSLADTPENWAKVILESSHERFNCDVSVFGYSIDAEAENLNKKYIELIKYEEQKKN